MGLMDYGLCGLYLMLVLSLGWYFRSLGGRSRSYYQADGSMGWIVVGLSVMVTLFSSVNFVAFPAEVAGYGLYVLASLPAFLLVLWPIRQMVIPLFRHLGTISGYAYFERRYDARVRRLASLIYLLWRVLWMAVALQACGQIVGGVTGWPVWQVILIIGIFTTLYTSIGGLKAVMWTDVAQFVVIVGGTAMALWIGIAGQGGVASTFQHSSDIGGLRPLSPVDSRFFSFSPFERITLWSALIGTVVALLARFGTDQMILQRYAAARSLKQAQRGFAFNIWATLFVLCLLALLGLVATTHAHATNLTLAQGVEQLSHLFRSLPSGARGVLVAGLLAAAMSSIDSGLNACASIWSQEFSRRPDDDDAPRESGTARAGRGNTLWLTVALGLIAIALSFAVGQLGTLFEIANRVINALGSPLLALMLLGLFSRRTTGFGMFWGGLIGIVLSVAISFGVQNLALHLYAVVNLLVTLAACRAMSLFGQPATSEQLAWTWRQLRRHMSV